MAPKKKRKVVGSVVRTKTTKKVVRETVEVSLVETNNNSEPQLTQKEEENRETTEETEEERVELDLSGKPPPARVIAVQDPVAKPKAEEQQPEKEPEYSTPPEDVVEDEFPSDEDHEAGEKETDKAEDEGKEEEEVPKDQVQPEQDEEKETEDLPKEVEAAVAETESPSEEASDIQEKEQAKEGEAETGKTKTEGGKKRGRKKRVKRMKMREREGYKRYIHRVLKQVHPELGISSNAITVLDGFMKDMFERLANEANNLTKYTEKMTLSSREVQAAVRLVLPGELGKHAVVEGNKAVANYISYDEGIGG